MAIDGARAAARDLGAQLVDKGLIDDVDDTFYLYLNDSSAPGPTMRAT